MKITKTAKKKTVVEVFTHNTDSALVIEEVYRDGKLSSISYWPKTNSDFHHVVLPVFLKGLTEDFLRTEYRSFSDLQDKLEIEVSTIDEVLENADNLYFLNEYSFLLFDKDMRIVSLPENLSYLGSLKEKCPNDPLYAQLISLLKGHPFIIDLEEKEIPYYNANFGGQKGLSSGKAYVPQELYEEIYESVKSSKKNWARKLNSSIGLNYDGCCNVYGDEITGLLKEHFERKAND